MRGINSFIIIFIVLGILILGFVLAVPPIWVGSDINYSTTEDIYYYHDLRNNISNYNNDVDFAIDTESSITWIKGNGTNYVSYDSVSSWISILNSSTGNFSITADHDDETGFFVIPIQATNTTDQEGSITNFEFVVNATNDFPSFTNILAEYNLSQNDLFINYTNGTDEEGHYPLYFNISFYNNCTLASWSTRTNCTLFNLTNVSSTSALMNFTPSRNDVGTYWADISMSDFGENYACPHAYCVNSNYQQNKSITSLVAFNVLSSLTINASDCQDKIFQENVSGSCQINITSRGETNSINLSSVADVRNYAASVSNPSWFYPDNASSAVNFNIVTYANVTPQKTEIGNWTINFTANDNLTGEEVSELIYVYVNRTSNDIPDLININDINTSVNFFNRINLTVYDDDLLIPDKNESYGGYNETTTFNVTILNQSDLGQELSLNGFNVVILNMPVAGTNRTEAKIEFTPNSSEAGNYTINITVLDNENAMDSELFNLSIVDNEFPKWNQTEYNFNLTVNSTLATTLSFGPINLTNGYANDTANDTLTFTNDSSAFPRFSLTSAGIISFTPYKEDVGFWNFSVTAEDSLGLQNQTRFIFNITNVNSDPAIETPLGATNATVDPNSSDIDCYEDNYTKITLWIQDDDIMIDPSQKSYYNESLSVNLTIVGNNPNLFNFIKTSAFPTPSYLNRTEFEANFTPNISDVGDYNITINVTDASGASDLIMFNLTVNSVNDPPTIMSLQNYSSAINRTFYYDINASDEEDGNDTSGNLIFSYNFLSGDDIFNSTVFNSTTGIINITFNSSQGGIYQINVTVNDTSDSMDSGVFFLTVYDLPNITYPAPGNNFVLTENITSNLIFRANHTVGNNLIYEFYLNGTLKDNLTYYGNDTNLTWQFTPNFTDETYGNYTNLTLVVYPSSLELANNSLFNQSLTWDINISHSNAPIIFNGLIGDKQATYDQNIQINLTEYFSDSDYSDGNYNQSINFSVSSDSSPSYISSSVSSEWIMTLSSLIAVTEILNITANDSSTNATSNNFTVQFTAPTTTTVPSSGGGGGGSGSVLVSLSILVPEPVSVNQIDLITVPITLHNDGKKTLSGINLSGIIAENNELNEDIEISFDQTYFPSLNIGEKKNTSMIVKINTEKNGTFEITLNATSTNPKYTDWSKLFLTIKESNESLREKLIFVQEFLEENPECIELEELLDEARAFFEAGDFINTVVKIQEAINGCKQAISQQARLKRKNPEENPLYRYLLVATIFVFILGIGYYSYERMKLRRGSNNYYVKKREHKIFNKRITPAIFTLALTGVLTTPLRYKITGLIVGETFTVAEKLGFSFLLMFVILGVMLSLIKHLNYRKPKEKKVEKLNNTSFVKSRIKAIDENI